MFQNVPASHEIDYHGDKLRLETGLLAQQATSSVVASLGETTVMANVVIGKKSPMPYFPLQVIYEEKMYASGKIMSSRFMKREGRPSEDAILTGRMIDRSLRSLFDSHFRNEVQVIVTVLSLDEVNPPDILGVLAASSALTLASKDFKGPVSSIRIGQNQEDLGKVWQNQVYETIHTVSDFNGISDLLTKVSQTLDIKNETDKNYIREIARILASKDPSWSKNFSELYKKTEKLSIGEIRNQYPVKTELLVNPNYEEIKNSSVDLVVSGDGESIMMVEVGADIISEEKLGSCFDKASEELAILTKFQNDFVSKATELGYAKKVEMELNLPDQKYKTYWHSFQNDLEAALYYEGSKEEKERELSLFKEDHFTNLEALKILIVKENLTTIKDIRGYLVSRAGDVIHSEVSAVLGQRGLNLAISQNLLDLIEDSSELKDINLDNVSQNHEPISTIDLILKNLEKAREGLEESLESKMKEIIQSKILNEEVRIDGRKLNEVRKITCQVDVLPRVHGSSLFQRGETQVLNILTIGSKRDAQVLDNMEDFEEASKRYIHHYNFPSYSVGETGRYGPPGRREIGHGALAEKALLPVLPNDEDFPYTMRLVSECLGSNGSTSMASTCSSCLSLLAGGVPLKDMVAGVAMGLVLDTESGHFKVLTDIQGAEDHFGDMDFKVTGTKDGVTAIQLDNKVAGLTSGILKQALIEAREGRLFILSRMQEAISEPRKEISKYAPRVLSTQIDPEKIGELIGPSGKNIKMITQKFEVEVDIEDDGKVYVYSKDSENAKKAVSFITKMANGYKVGDIVNGVVYRIENYGAFIKILDEGEETGKEGLIHISNISSERVNKVEDHLKLNQNVSGKVVEINEKGQIAVSLKE
jgi:polyribonucleotide nucleotidyltransferase